MPTTVRSHSPHLREAPAVAELLVAVFRRDLLSFYPQAKVRPDPEPEAGTDGADDTEGETTADPAAGPAFRLIERDGEPRAVDLFGHRYRLEPRAGTKFSPRDSRMIRAIGAVLNLRYHSLFQVGRSSRMEIYRGGSEDHYVAAFVEPEVYAPEARRGSRVASTLQTLRTAALSTYENRRVSTGVLLLSPTSATQRAPADALPFGVELTSLKSVHKLCDGERTVFLVDGEGRLVEIIDIARWASGVPVGVEPDVPCARAYAPHARATRAPGDVCVVLSPNQEIKLFADGAQAFSFAHGRWRVLDPAGKFASWSEAVGRPDLARVLFQTALDLAETRQGALFVVVDRPLEALGRLISPHDLVSNSEAAPPTDLLPGDPLAKRALHYLARGRNVIELDPPVLEALAGLDGALVSDRNGRLLAFGAILRHDAASHGLASAEGARTTAALVASRFGPVLKVSEDGVISCFLQGARAWDL